MWKALYVYYILFYARFDTSTFTNIPNWTPNRPYMRVKLTGK